MVKALGIFALLLSVCAGWAMPAGAEMPLAPQVASLPTTKPSEPLDHRACTPDMPCCPTALAQLTGPPCRVGCPGPPPKKVLNVAPDLTNVAKPYPSGVVILELVINEKGVPLSSCVLRGIRDDFDKAAQMAALRWGFEPKSLEGKPLGVVMTVTVTAPDMHQDGRSRDGTGWSKTPFKN